MDTITLIIGIIVFFLVLGLILRIVGYVLKIASVVILLICFLVFIGSYLQASAYYLDSQHEAYLIATSSLSHPVVVIRHELGQYSYDSGATQELAVKSLQLPLATNDAANASLSDLDAYSALKEYAQTSEFNADDTVWFVDARSQSGCTQSAITKDPAQLPAICLSPKTSISPQLLLNQQERDAVLHRIPLKSSLWEWLQHKVFG